MKIAFFGSSRALPHGDGEVMPCRRPKALAGFGHDIAFYEPDALGPPWAKVVVYPATSGRLRSSGEGRGRRRVRRGAFLEPDFTPAGR
jgi:hypothetical protein